MARQSARLARAPQLLAWERTVRSGAVSRAFLPRTARQSAASRSQETRRIPGRHAEGSRMWRLENLVKSPRAVGPLFAVGSTAQARRAAWGTPASASLTSASFVMRTMALRTPYAKPLRKCCAVPMNSQISAHITHSPRATREWMLVPLRATLSVWLGEIRMTPRISRCLLRRSTSTRE